MTTPDLLEIAREGLITALLLTLPLLGAALAASLISAALQAFTRISEPTLTYVPRIVAVGAALLVTAPWMGERLSRFAVRVWTLVSQVNLS